jgi:transposase
MLTLALPSRIFVCTEPADMRRSFDGLAALVQQHLDCDPLLEKGTFPWPSADGSRTPVGPHGLTLRPAELAMLLDGIELTHVQRRQRYQRPTPPTP